jgi:tRNA(Ile)-lysidine synthase
MSFLLKKVQEILHGKLNNHENYQFLLAVSGGIDSMVLLSVFHHLGLNFHVAHANFQLRSEESNQDELFVREQSKKYDIPYSKIHIKKFDTMQEHEKTKDTSVQMLARKLRYEWFYTLLEQYQLNYVVTAHHADDNIETFFLKLFRKSPQGMAGMDWVSEKKIFRPLLTSFRNEIEQYATENNISYREDSSNTKDDYLRNHIRHHLVPFIETNYPQAKNAILNTMQYQKDLNTLAYAYTDEIWKNTVSKYEDCYTIDLIKLQQYSKSIQEILPWHFAERFCIGMKQFEQFKHLFDIETPSGKEMVTKSYKAVRYKKSIQVFPPNEQNIIKRYYTHENVSVLRHLPKEYILIGSDNFNKNDGNSFWNNVSKIRRWFAGDKILHKGKEKLVADLIPEYHITTYQKEYLYMAIRIIVEPAPMDNIITKRYSHQNNHIYKEVINFIFFCPNSVLLQLKENV